MEVFRDKLRILIFPLLIVAIGFMAVYTLIHWLVFIKAGLSLNEDVILGWLPAMLSVIPMLKWIRPRIKLISFQKENSSSWFQFLCLLVICIPTVVCQHYFATAVGRLTELEDIDQFKKHKITKYYSLKQSYIDKEDVAIYSMAELTGSRNDKFSIAIYFATPILVHEGGITRKGCKYWLVKKYSVELDNDYSAEQRERIAKRFLIDWRHEFDTANLKQFDYLEVMGNTSDRRYYHKAIGRSFLASRDHNYVLMPRTGRFEDRNGNRFVWIFGSLVIVFALWTFFVLCSPPFDRERLQKFKRGIRMPDAELADLLAIFTPSKGYSCTPFIVDLNILVYLAMFFQGLGFVSFHVADLAEWGGNFRPLTVDAGEWWRLLSCMFLHGGIIHIIGNLVGLISVGIVLEPLIGKWKFLLIYLVTGIVASATSTWWHAYTVSVGASGAIFGIYGFFLACLITKVYPREFVEATLVGIVIFVLVNLAMGFAGGVDNAAHIGGLVSGFVLGICVSGLLKRSVGKTPMQ